MAKGDDGGGDWDSRPYLSAEEDLRRYVVEEMKCLHVYHLLPERHSLDAM